MNMISSDVIDRQPCHLRQVCPDSDLSTIYIHTGHRALGFLPTGSSYLHLFNS